MKPKDPESWVGDPRSEEDDQPGGMALSIDRSGEWPQTALGLAPVAAFNPVRAVQAPRKPPTVAGLASFIHVTGVTSPLISSQVISLEDNYFCLKMALSCEPRQEWGNPIGRRNVFGKLQTS